MRAIIDIGTNSVRLLMAEKDEKGEWKTLRKELRSTRLGEGMTDKATIGQGAKERTLSAVEEFTAMAKLEGAEDIFAYGTSIMRDASNGEEFADEVTAASGVPVVRGERTLEEAEELIQKNTRHFAKRQLTWYRRMPYIHWVEKTPSDGDIWYREILAYVISQVRGESQDGR